VLAVAATVVGAPIAGAAVLVLPLSVISLRGYLAPGTPELTKRHLPDGVLHLFVETCPDCGVWLLELEQ
jgi:hypothetical protein